MMTPEAFVGPATPLAPADLAAAAAQLQVSLARVRAVDEVESRGRGFHPESRRPIILFEPHVFSRRTQHRFDASHPEVSYPTWNTRPYPPSQAQRYAQLFAAMALDETEALKSASWGRFQIMGLNHAAAGFPTVQAFVAAMVKGEGEQMGAFARFVLANPGLLAALRTGDWAGFARLYNGPNFAAHGYDQKLKVAYARALSATAQAGLGAA
ncbi:MAG TPA: N-acetylmuramidase family protein [Phenylobacterium sp.]